MITLRELKRKDASLMLEWMHDPDIQKGFKKNMLTAEIKDVEKFCVDSAIPDHPRSGENLHFAITDENDEYLGTVSLKKMDFDNKSAEYAIALRKGMHGKGIAYNATGIILKKAFKEYGLHRIYLSVLADNNNAIRLYERCGFVFEGEFRDHFLINGNYVNWKWYSILREEFDEKNFEL